MVNYERMVISRFLSFDVKAENIMFCCWLLTQAIDMLFSFRSIDALYLWDSNRHAIFVSKKKKKKEENHVNKHLASSLLELEKEKKKINNHVKAFDIQTWTIYAGLGCIRDCICCSDMVHRQGWSSLRGRLPAGPNTGGCHHGLHNLGRTVLPWRVGNILQS